jgi:hypothetical protein
MKIVLTISKVIKGGHRGKPAEKPSERGKSKNVIDLHDYCKNKQTIVV